MTLDPIHIDQRLADITIAFQCAARGQNTIVNAVIGLRGLIEAATQFPGVASVEVITTADQWMNEAMHAVIQAVDDRLTWEDCATSFGAARGILALFGSQDLLPGELRCDQIDTAAILAARLEIIARRRAISTRGNVLVRCAAITVASAIVRMPNTPVH
ncbi:hypothetical protein GCM10007036_16570 [Alsobacter metallidurans]|uniref:Uncharacterized protein n=1 Tax=Alsobacter metallidurans TaxID=340221 RepID=A0A917MJ92_9HYPH|nr:hypothetical protein [Alsobacter metallidurans]GGH16129.1 hypothetical protein GCM10007036_16570 [Alsobacter metallidurans]